MKAWLAHRFTRDILINPVPPWPVPGEAVVKGSLKKWISARAVVQGLEVILTCG